MRSPVVITAVALLALVAGCGGSEPGETTSPPAPEAAESPMSTQSPMTTQSPTSTQSPMSTESPMGGGSAAGGTQVLTGTIGEPGDPDAFVITLTDSTGAEVTELTAGDYTVEIDDPSAIHNFHLSGPGVEETTTVEEVTTVSWDVTLEAGDYDFVCDPHPNMAGAFTVT